ncbi:MAG: hypothetical protein LAO24_00920 [Acidobacteriia bacterium]|nr:hypothetical protein [Terriglobia bacterium]
MNSTILPLLFIALTVPATGLAQTQGNQEKTAIPSNQRVTIELERFDEASGKLWLRLRNSTAWDIRIPVETAFPGEKITGEVVKSARSHKDGAEAPVRYYLEEFSVNNPSAAAKLPPVPKIHRYDFLTEWWIPKGESILFVVPKERLAMNVMLSVSLRYEWEDLGPEVLDGPVHLVYFRGIDLPDDVQLKINSKFWKDWTAPKP